MSTKKSGTSRAIELVGKSQPMILIPGAKLSRTAMVLDAKVIKWAMAEKIAQFLGGLAQANQWWLGDFINFTEATFGEKYVQLATITGYSEQALMDMRWVSEKVISSCRQEISFEHHKAVAPLSAEDQKKWLTIATDERLTVKELRASIKAGEIVRADPKTGETPKERGGINTIQGWSSLAVKWIHETTDRQPIERWSEGRKAEIAAMLDPIVEFHSRLKQGAHDAGNEDMQDERAATDETAPQGAQA